MGVCLSDGGSILKIGCLKARVYCHLFGRGMISGLFIVPPCGLSDV